MSCGAHLASKNENSLSGQRKEERRAQVAEIAGAVWETRMPNPEVEVRSVNPSTSQLLLKCPVHVYTP